MCSAEARAAMRRAVFLDRDGTINEEVNYLSRVEDFRMLPGVAAAIRSLQARGWTIVVITNQAGIARGYFTAADMEAIHARMLRELAAEGASVDAIYYCPHGPANQCDCRKPSTGMFRQAALELGLDLSASIGVGDKLTDLLPAQHLGCRTVLVLTGYGMEHAARVAQGDFHPDHIAADLVAAAQWILQLRATP